MLRPIASFDRCVILETSWASLRISNTTCIAQVKFLAVFWIWIDSRSWASEWASGMARSGRLILMARSGWFVLMASSVNWALSRSNCSRDLRSLSWESVLSITQRLQNQIVQRKFLASAALALTSEIVHVQGPSERTAKSVLFQPVELGLITFSIIISNPLIPLDQVWHFGSVVHVPIGATFQKSARFVISCNPASRL